MKKNNLTIYKMFDLLHEGMSYDEIINFVQYMIDLKMQDSNLYSKIDSITLLVGEKMGREGLRGVPISFEYTYPFMYYDKLYIDDATISDAMNGNMGKLISFVGHELEHIYQTYFNVVDKVDYNTYIAYDLSPTLEKNITRRFGKEDREFVRGFLETMKEVHHDHYYHSSYQELSANAMGTLYYGFNLKHYAKFESNPTRRDWLNQQVRNIWAEQEIMNELNADGLQKVKETDRHLVKINLLEILKMSDRSQDFQDLVANLYDMAKPLKLDKDFNKRFGMLYTMKYFGNESLREVNKLIGQQITVLDKVYEADTHLLESYHRESSTESDDGMDTE